MRAFPTVFLAALLCLGAALPSLADPGVATHEPVVDKVSPAIVTISCKSPPRKGTGARGEMGWFGTGTVISEDGAILTSTTVIPTDVKPDSILVSFAGGKQMKAEFVAASAELEIAMVRLPKGTYKHVPMGDSKSLKLGHVVYTFGNCNNMMDNDDEVAFAQGEVSGFYKITDTFEGKAWYDWCSYKGPVIETTAPLNPGVDGGPLIDAKGRLVGIMSLSYNETRWLGVAIPQEVLADRVSHWLKGEIVKDKPKDVVKNPPPDEQPQDPPDEGSTDDDPYLGVTLESDAAVIKSIAKNSPADKAKEKLAVGDRIVSVEGRKVKTPAGFLKALRAHKPNEVVKIVVDRNGESLTLEVKLGYPPM